MLINKFITYLYHKYFNFFCLLILFIFYISIINADNKFSNNKSFIITSKLPNAFIMGQSSLTFLGLNIYDIKLWSRDSDFNFNNIALEILYHKNFSKEKVINRSIKEIKLQKAISNKIEHKYKEYLKDSLININNGDIMIAILSNNNEISFYHNNNFINKIIDRDFAIDFFNIWLSNNSSYPNITNKLLNND